VTEPTGQRLDGTPWDEARPPHLPDAVTRVSPWVYPFLVAALVHVWLLWTDLALQTGLELRRVPAIAATLFGAALFLRHPDARPRLPLLAFGVVLFALAELLDAGSGAVTRFLEGVLPSGDPSLPVSPVSTAWSLFTALVGIFAVLYMAAGLSAARVRDSVAAAGQLAVWLSVLAIVIFALSVLSLVNVRGIDTSPWSLVTLALGIGLTLASTVVWTYLLVVSLNGWLAGETPRFAWALAAIAAALFLLVRLANGVGAASVPDSVNMLLINLVGYGSVLAWFVLLAAFAVGLPGPASDADESASDADESAVRPDPPAATPPGSAAG
jgi:hypothetical protein